MTDRFRNKVVTQLAEELNHLTGGSFEQFGYKVMPLIHPGDWIERGTTIDGAARKATVDTSLGGAAYVGEMSSTAGYFDGKLDKPRGDLQHVVSIHPQVQHIWLLSSRTTSGGQTTAIDNAIAKFKDSYPSVKSATVLDARRIAGHIFDHLGKRDLVRDLSHYLPGLARLAEEHAFSESIPPVEAFSPRATVEAAIVEALESSSYVILQGMSGIGKTALAARVAHQVAPQFDNCIWLDAREIDGIEKLKSVALTRSGVSHNIVNLVRTERVLLVIDDPAFPLPALANLEYGSSKVIVTTQVASGPRVLPIVDLEPQEAQSVLTAEVGQCCPATTLARVLHIAGGHPLIIRALNRLAIERGWAAVDECVASESVSELEDDRNQNIFRRILRGHADLAYELQFVRWLGSRQFAEELARAGSSVLVEKLLRRGLLAATTVGYVRIHDLVYDAIQTEVAVENNVEERLRERMAAFIRRECETDRTLLHRLARTQHDFFQRITSKHGRPEFVYMLAMHRATASAISLLGDPVAAASELARHSCPHECMLEIRAVIEVVEALYTLRDAYGGKDEARIRLGSDIQALAVLLQIPGLSDEQLSMLQYHRAKMLSRLDAKGEVARKQEAIQCFRELLERFPSFTAARNQLAKILPAKASVEQCEIVLERHVREPGSVGWNVVLDSLRLLVRNGGDMAKHEDLLMSTIDYAKSIDPSEAIRLVASVGQRAWFAAPQLLVPMFDALGHSKEDSAPTTAFDLAQVYKFAALESDEPDRTTVLGDALHLYSFAKPNGEYQVAHYAEALLLAGQHQQALDILARVPPNRRSAYWLQRHAEALSGVGDHTGALTAIDKAIETIPEPSLLADFYRSRFRVRRAAGSEDARIDLERAVTLLPDRHPFRGELRAELARD